MSEYNFSIDISTENFEVKIDPDEGYGYFEHKELGDECGGGLWFSEINKRELVDYDGVFSLPREVYAALINASFIADDSFNPDAD